MGHFKCNRQFWLDKLSQESIAKLKATFAFIAMIGQPDGQMTLGQLTNHPFWFLQSFNC